MTTVGFIGLGNLGQKLAANLVTAGFDLVVRDTNQAAATPLLSAGASWAYSPRELAQQSDVIITCLPSHAVSTEVMEASNGLLAGLFEGKLWLEMSTTEAADVKRLARMVEGVGAMAMDAPVAGGCHRAASGTMAIFAGGSVEAFDAASPVLDVMARDVVHTGDIGSASELKLVTDYLSGVQLVATGEALMVAKRAGFDLSVAYEAILVSGGNSYVHETQGQVILNGSYNNKTSMARDLKAATLFDELGKTLDIPLELSPLLVHAMQEGLETYGSEAWSAMVVKRLEEACHSDLRAPGFPAELADHDISPDGFQG